MFFVRQSVFVCVFPGQRRLTSPALRPTFPRPRGCQAPCSLCGCGARPCRGSAPRGPVRQARWRPRRRAMAWRAFSGPKPRWPSQRSMAPKLAVHTASAAGSISPLRRYSTTRGKRFSPWLNTPARLFWAKISAASWARSGLKPYFFSTRSNSASMVS